MWLAALFAWLEAQRGNVALERQLEVVARHESLETPIGEEEDSHLGDFIEDRSAVSPAENVINLNLKEEGSRI
jgi:RNA polymerase primary sigma factor